MIGAWLRQGSNYFLVPEAHAVTSEQIGSLILAPRPWGFSVAPDGGWVAWTTDDLPDGEPFVFFTDNRLSTRRVPCKGHFGHTAISSGAGRIAVIGSLGQETTSRVMLLNPGTGKVEGDVTELITSIPLRDISRFQISSSGNRLAVASSKSFMVIDLPSRKLVFQDNGECASLSPQGETLASLDVRGELVLTTLATRASRILSNTWGSILGVGGWTPDGRFLLAGASPVLAFNRSLLAIDTVTGKFARIMPLEMEGDHGQTTIWIKRSLLT